MRKVNLPTSFVSIVVASLITGAGVSGTYAACVKGVSANDVLNMRSGPGKGYKIVGFLRPRKCGISVLRYEGRWAYVDHGRGGFVNRRYLRREDGGGDGNQGRLKCVRGVASNDVLNMRRRPTESSKIIGVIPPNGCYIKVVKRQGRWARVRYNGANGWVNRRFLTR